MKIRIRPFFDVEVEERKTTPFKDIFGNRIQTGVDGDGRIFWTETKTDRLHRGDFCD